MWLERKEANIRQILLDCYQRKLIEAARTNRATLSKNPEQSLHEWILEGVAPKIYPCLIHFTNGSLQEGEEGRFLNIISLFNGFIPLIVIQLNAIQVEQKIALIFTLVLDQRLGLALDEEEEQETTDRSYWEKRGSFATVNMADELLGVLKEIDDELELKYNNFYIGLPNNKPFNFPSFDQK